MSFSNFSSWPPAQEQQFAVFEQYNKDSTSKAFIAAGIAGAAVFIFAIGLYIGIDPPPTVHKETPQLSRKADPAPAPTPAPAAAPAAPAAEAAAPAAAPAAGSDTPAAAPAAAPAAGSAAAAPDPAK